MSLLLLFAGVRVAVAPPTPIIGGAGAGGGVPYPLSRQGKRHRLYPGATPLSEFDEPAQPEAIEARAPEPVQWPKGQEADPQLAAAFRRAFGDDPRFNFDQYVNYLRTPIQRPATAIDDDEEEAITLLLNSM
jgi:hypothetical protein